MTRKPRLVGFLCAFVLLSGASTVFAETLFCWVEGDGDVECVSRDEIDEVLEAIQGAARAYELRQILDELESHYAVRTGKALIECTSGAAVVFEPGDSPRTPSDEPAPRPEPTDVSKKDRDAIRKKCEVLLDDGLKDQFDIAGGGATYTNAVDQTKKKINEQLENCQSSVHQWVAWSPVKVATEIFKIPYNMAKAQRAKEASRRGARDVFAGKPPQEKMKDWSGTSSPYGQQYNNGRKVLEAQCKAGNTSACATLEKIEKETPKPDPKPADPDPKPEPDPEPEGPNPQPGVTRCVEETCRDYCAERKRAWKEFMAECDRANWSLYKCKALVSGMNNCPDPAEVRPDPERGFTCSVPMTEEQKRAVAEVVRCEEQRKVAYGVDGEFRCANFQPISPDDAFDFWRRKQCLYMSSEDGRCPWDPSVPGRGSGPGPSTGPWPKGFPLGGG